MRFKTELKKARKEINRELKQVEKQGLGDSEFLANEIISTKLQPAMNDYFQMSDYPVRYAIDPDPGSDNELLVIIGPLNYKTPHTMLEAFTAWSTKWASGRTYWQRRPLVTVQLEAPVPTLLYAVVDMPESDVAKALG